MKKYFLLFLLLLSLSSLVYAASSLDPLDSDSVIQTLEEKTMTTIPLSTLGNHLVVNSLTIYFNKRGFVTGEFSKQPAKNPKKDRGTWTVNEDGALCITWQHWTKGKAFCDYVYDAKNSLIFLDANGKFVSLALKTNIR